MLKGCCTNDLRCEGCIAEREESELSGLVAIGGDIYTNKWDGSDSEKKQKEEASIYIQHVI